MESDVSLVRREHCWCRRRFEDADVEELRAEEEVSLCCELVELCQVQVVSCVGKAAE